MVLVYFTCLVNLGIFFFTIETGLLQRARKKESDAKLEITTTLPRKRRGFQLLLVYTLLLLVRQTFEFIYHRLKLIV